MANLATINNNILADSGIDPLSLIVGTGTVNYVPKFTAEDTVANSQIFDNGTNVGIGTTSPVTKLDVNGAGVIRGFLTTTDAIKLGGNTSAPTSTDAFIYRPADNTLAFGTASAERMRLDVSGNLLVGLSSALANGKLQVAGSIGLSGNTQIRQATNSDGNTLQVFATQVIAGNLNSYSYGYSGGGLLASVSAGDSILLFDAGRTTSTEGGVKIANTTLGNVSFSVEKNGVTTLFASTLGNVGIGTSSPSYPLTVGVGGSATGVLRAGTSFVSIDAGYQSAGVYGTAIAPSLIFGGDDNTGIWHPASDVLAVSTGGSERMRITSGGNLLVGTATSDGSQFRVYGGYITLGDGAYEGLIGKASTIISGGNVGDLGIRSAGGISISSGGNTERVRITSTGNVGIGTSSPTSKLQVLGTGRTLNVVSTNDQAAASFGSSGYAVSTIGFYGIGSANDYNVRVGASVDAFVAYTNDTERMRITSGGNVGIGTTSPAQLLEIQKNQNATTQLLVSNSDVTNSSSRASVAATSGTVTMRMESIGTLGGYIGTTSNHYVDFWTNATERMRLTSGGNLLVGTTTDAGYKLDVSGTARITSNLLAQKVQVGTAATINDAAGVANTLQFANYTAGTFITGSADNYIYKTSNVIGTLSAQTLIFQTRSDVAGGGFAFVSGATPSVIANISSNGAVRLNVYGSGSFTGTRAYDLSVDASGNIIEVPVGAGTITGSGTTNYIPKFTSSSAIGNSIIYETGGLIGIGTTTPAEFVHLKTSSYATPLYVEYSGGTSAYIGLANSGGRGYLVSNNNDLVFATSSSATERMRITSGGNVGIGSSSPFATTKLSVYTSQSGSSPNALLRLENTGTSYQARMVLTDGTTSDGIIAFQGGVTAATQYLGFGIGSTPTQMILTGGGNVGIGTTSPEAKLDVFGSSSDQIRLRTAASEYYRIGRNASTGYLDFWGSQSGYVGYTWSGVNGERMRLDSSGNLGLGVVPSAWYLTFKAFQFGANGSSIFGRSENNMAAFASNAYVNSVGSFTYINTNTASYYQQLNGEHQWYNAPSGTAGNAISFTQAMTLDASGRLGIGTTSPTYKLHINTSNNNDGIAIYYPTTSLQFPFYVGDNSNGTYAQLSAYDFEFKRNGGASTIKTVGSNNNLILQSANNLVFNTNGATERMRITDGGNVLVGTTTDVSGVGKFVINYASSDNYGIILNNTYTATSNNGYFQRFYNNGTEIGTFYAGNAASSLFSIVGKDGLSFATNGVPVGTERMRIATTGAVRFNAYGSGSFTGTVAYNLAVDASGNIIETAGGVVDGSGTANYVPKWSDPNTLTNSLLSESGSDVTLNGSSTNVQFVLTNTNSSSFGIQSYFQEGYFNMTGTGDLLWRMGPSFIERMKLTNSGNLGLGVTPSAHAGGGSFQLGSGKNISFSGQEGYLAANQFYNGSSSVYISNGYATQYAQESGIHKWLTAPSGTAGNAIFFTQAMTLDASGRLGIGTTSPSYTFDVSKTIAADFVARIANTSSTGYGLYVQANDNTKPGIRIANASGGTAIDLFGSGAGTFSNTLTVNANSNDAIFSNVNGQVLGLKITQSDVSYDAVFRMQANGHFYDMRSTSTNAFTIGYDGSERMRITSGGNVLIGTTTDRSYKLLVEGTDNNNLMGSYNATSGASIRMQSNQTVNYIVSATNPLQFEIGSAIRMSMQTNGNVGIGTTSPSNKLDVIGRIISSASGNQALLGASDIQSGGATVYLNSAFAGAGTPTVQVETNHPLLFATNNTERMRIAAGGRVGIGTTNPEATLHVFGSGGTFNSSIYISDYAADMGLSIYSVNLAGTPSVRLLNGFYSYRIWLSGDASGDLNFSANWASTTPQIKFTGSGNVGIGTTSPACTLDVRGNAQVKPSTGTDAIWNRASNDSGEFYLGIDNSAGSGFTGTAYARFLYATNFYPMTFHTNNSERMRITSGGNVLVGTTTDAGYKLYVNGTAKLQSALYLGGNSDIIDPSSNSGFMTIGSNQPIRFTNASTTEYMRITTSGNVGIGTSSPSDTLHVTGSVRSNSGSSYEVTNHGTFTLNDGTLGNYVDFLVVGSTNVGSSFVELTLSETNIGHGSIKYFIPTNYDDVYVSQTRVVLPLYTTNPRFGYAGGGYGSAIQELQIIANNTGNYTLRLVVRKVGDGSAPAWYWTAKLKNCAVSSTPNTTGINSTAYSLYRHTPLMQYDNKVGIGTAQPSATLNVVSTGNAAYTCIVTEDNARRLKIGRDQISAYDLSENPAQLYIQGNGSNVAMVTAGGNVGIGTSGPSYKLDVVGTTARVRDAGNVNYVSLSIYGGVYLGGNGTGGVRYAGTETNDNFALVANNSEKVRITTGGYVGIGTSSPSYKLQVAGGDIAIDYGRYLRGGSGGDWNLINLYNGGTGDMEITMLNTNWYLRHNANATFAGRVGIGTTSPSTRLHISNAANGNIALFTNTNDADLFINLSSGVTSLSPSTGILAFGTSSTERMRLDANGNLGIGTSSPDQIGYGAGTILGILSPAADATNLQLGVVGSSGATSGSLADINFFGKNATASVVNRALIRAGIDGATNSNFFSFWTMKAGSLTEKMRLDASGNLGLGVTPSAWSNIFNVIQGPQGSVVAFQNNGNSLKLGSNFYYAGVNYNYINTNAAARYDVDAEHRWYIAPSGTAGNVISFTQAMTLNASGNLLVGGTSDNGSRLQVTGGITTSGTSTGAYVGLSIRNTSTGAAQLRLSNSSQEWLVNTRTDNHYSVYNETSGTTPFLITTGGNVGIGTTSPAYPLHIDNSLQQFRVSGNSNNFNIYSWASGINIWSTENIYFGRDAATSNKFFFQSGNGASTALYINTAANNIGIGTSSLDGGVQFQVFTSSSPQNLTRLYTGLDVYGPSGSSSAASPAIFMGGDSNTGFFSPTGDNIGFSTNGSERMRITNGGIVGIGTSSPDASTMLQVQTSNSCSVRIVSSALSGGDLYLTSVNSGSESRIDKQGTAGPLTFYNNGSERMRITSSGNTELSGSIKTGAPSGGTAKPIKFGEIVTLGGSNLQGVKVEIDGTLYYLVTGYLP